MVVKLITNKTAVDKKYGDLAAVFWGQADKLIAADRNKGIITELVFLDDAQQMLTIKTNPVTNASDGKQNKEAIDGVFRGYNPHYMVLLGASDIIPFQILDNPVYQSGYDPEKYVPSDLPYACEAGYSTKIGDFLTPTRMVTRLPDVVGKGTNETLAVFIKTVDAVISNYQEPIGSYQDAWFLYNKVWITAMKKYLPLFAGSGVKFHEYTSPPDGPDWGNDVYMQRAHIHVLHGDEEDNELCGEDASGYPVALEGPRMQDKLKNGTISVIGACYGAQLYAPNTKGKPLANICLSSGSNAFIGSTNSVLCSSSDLTAADYICCYFLRHLLEKQTVGEAMLAARDETIQTVSLRPGSRVLDAPSQKTLGQFAAYGYGRVELVQGIASGEERLVKHIEEIRQRAGEPGAGPGYMERDPDARPSKAAESYIADYFQKRGIQSRDGGWEITVYRLAGNSKSPQDRSGDGAGLKQYGVAAKADGKTKLYLFTEENGTIVSVKEYERR